MYCMNAYEYKTCVKLQTHSFMHVYRYGRILRAYMPGLL